jgi:hypothetical protein
MRTGRPQLTADEVARRRRIARGVLSDFKAGNLRSSTGHKVTKRKAAIAIALQMAGRDGEPPAAESPKVAEALSALAAENPGLARLVQPAGRRQLALFHDTTPRQTGHVWRFEGLERAAHNAKLFSCAKCPARKRTTAGRGWSQDLYAMPGDAFAPEAPTCRDEKERARHGA